jgi:hypothetical protein
MQPVSVSRSGEKKVPVSRLLTYVVIIIGVVWVISTPAPAGADVHLWIIHVFSFFQHLVHG